MAASAGLVEAQRARVRCCRARCRAGVDRCPEGGAHCRGRDGASAALVGAWQAGAGL